MLLQTTRVKNLDEQLKGRIAALQDRNAQIKSLNDQLGDAQKALAGDKDNGDKQKRVTQLKGQIDLMNSDSQLDMIGLQSLVNKRNEAFDMLSNLLNKFQKTMDGIVGNMR
jgi:DNA repair ATPase RecN